jgi:hypothetical protein
MEFSGYLSLVLLCATTYFQLLTQVRIIFTDDLISTIKNDIDTANRQLETYAIKILKDHIFFQP